LAIVEEILAPELRFLPGQPLQPILGLHNAPSCGTLREQKLLAPLFCLIQVITTRFAALVYFVDFTHCNFLSKHPKSE
jgi:hypothetical protein